MTGLKRKKICINFDKSDTSFQSCVVHSRYSSAAKVYERNKPRKVASPTWEMRSAYPLRENIWEYLNEDKNAGKFNCSSKRRTRLRCKQTNGNAENNKMWLVLLLVLAAAAVMTYSRLSDFIAQSKFITKVVPKTRLISLLHMEPSVEDKCCHVMNTVTASLLKAEQALRSTQRIRRFMIISQNQKIDIAPPLDVYRRSCVDADGGLLEEGFLMNPEHVGLYLTQKHARSDERDYIEDAAVMRGSGTREWGGRVALWGVVPLWRASPPLSTVLATRTPVPHDCWPFRGSHGEIIIHLGQKTKVRSISVEHIKPDTAKSAPKDFVLYDILENGTWVKTIEAKYKPHGPAKQFFEVTNHDTAQQRMVLRILSNQGNPTYTCVYRVHFYRNTA